MRFWAAVPPPEAAGELSSQKAQRRPLTLWSLRLGWSATTTGRLAPEMRRRRRWRLRPGGQDARRCEVIRGGLDEGEEARARLRRVTRPLTSLEDEQEVKRVFFFLTRTRAVMAKSTGNCIT